MTSPEQRPRVEGEEPMTAAEYRQLFVAPSPRCRRLIAALEAGEAALAANATLTAEVARLRGEKAEATGSVRFERSGDGVSIIDERGKLAVYVCRDDLPGLATLVAAALALPTNAQPEVANDES